MNSQRQARRPKPKNFTHQKPISFDNGLSKEDINYIKSLVIHETRQYLVFDKPSGLAVQGGSGVTRDIDNLLLAFTKDPKKKPKLVHRIDRETSGILLVAKNRTTAAMLSEQFANKSTQKTYYAIVSGVLPESGVINVPLKRGRVNNIDIALVARDGDKDAADAETIYENVKTNGKLTLVRLYPKTGRMHQLRAHMAHIGHPILGDIKYGGFLSFEGKKIPRLMLHAQSLKINTPDGVKTFESVLPNDMNDWI